MHFPCRPINLTLSIFQSGLNPAASNRTLIIIVLAASCAVNARRATAFVLILNFDVRRSRATRRARSGRRRRRRRRRHRNVTLAVPLAILKKRVDAVQDRRRQCKELYKTRAHVRTV